MNIKTVAQIAVTLVLFIAACGGQESGPPSNEQRRYVADICEPFASYLEGAIEMGVGSLELEEATSMDDFLPLMREARANSQVMLDDFFAVTPPQALRETHDQVIAVLAGEIGAFDVLETALESGDEEQISQAISESAQAPSLSAVGPTGFFSSDVPGGYEEVWNEDCVPRLRQIPAA